MFPPHKMASITSKGPVFYKGQCTKCHGNFFFTQPYKTTTLNLCMPTHLLIMTRMSEYEICHLYNLSQGHKTFNSNGCSLLCLFYLGLGQLHHHHGNSWSHSWILIHHRRGQSGVSLQGLPHPAVNDVNGRV